MPVTFCVPNDEDVLLGDVSKQETHPGTRCWAQRVARYAKHGTPWSTKISSRLAEEFRGKRFLVQGDIQANTWLLACKVEIVECTKELFENGGGKASSLPSNNNKRAPPKQTSGAVKNQVSEGKAPVYCSIRKGQTVFTFEHLWVCKVWNTFAKPTFAGEAPQGTMLQVKWHGFGNKRDLLDLHRVVPVTVDASAFLEQLVRKTYQDLSQGGPLRLPAPTIDSSTCTGGTTNVPHIGDIIYCFENVWKGKVQKIRYDESGVASYQIKYIGFKEVQNPWVSGHQVLAPRSGDKSKHDFLENLSQQTFQDLAMTSPTVPTTTKDAIDAEHSSHSAKKKVKPLSSPAPVTATKLSATTSVKATQKTSQESARTLVSVPATNHQQALLQYGIKVGCDACIAEQESGNKRAGMGHSSLCKRRGKRGRPKKAYPKEDIQALSLSSQVVQQQPQQQVVPQRTKADRRPLKKRKKYEEQPPPRSALSSSLSKLDYGVAIGCKACKWEQAQRKKVTHIKHTVGCKRSASYGDSEESQEMIASNAVVVQATPAFNAAVQPAIESFASPSLASAKKRSPVQEETIQNTAHTITSHGLNDEARMPLTLIVSPDTIPSCQKELSTSRKSTTADRQPQSKVAKKLQAAKEKCNALIQRANSTDEEDDLVILRQGAAAEMARNVLEILDELPTMESLQMMYDSARGTLMRRLETSAIENIMQKWEKAQYHVVALVDDVTSDDCVSRMQRTLIESPDAAPLPQEELSTSRMTTAADRQPHQLNVAKKMEIAMEKCDALIQRANKTDEEGDDLDVLRQGATAEMVRKVLEILDTLPTMESLRTTYNSARGSLMRRLEASAILNIMQKWEKAQHHVAALVHDLTSDY